ncbi:MAG: PEP-CTERM sorting domain-containing protein [Candidatus Solibacter sp.]|nr:PEP-CTERM sorting domain-containing protein [Candidatus Solibacter sp.]
MTIRNSTGLAVLAFGFGLCPSLLAVSYTWNFTGSAGSNCIGASCLASEAGNSIVFAAGPSGGPTVKASAWYINGGGTFQKATLGQYSHGLGICYPGENCTNPDHQVDNSTLDEFVLLEFSAPVDPASVDITSTSSGGLDVSYWLGGTAGQNLNLTGSLTSSLAGLGFGLINDNPTALTGSRTVDLTGGVPAGTVNAILFGGKLGDNNDFFKVGGMAGSTATAVPEPSSVILLCTVTLLGLRFSRRAKRSREITG